MLLSREGLDVSPSRQSGVSFTCKRICRVPRARNSEREVEQRKVWGRTFNLLRIEGTRFDVNMSRGRGYARVSETPECYVPSKGPNISVMAAMSPELGVIHETHRGGVTAALFAQFLDRLFPILHRVYKEAPVVLVMDNAVIPDGTVIAAGAVVLENKVLEPGIWAGIPAKKVKDASDRITSMAHDNAMHYIEYKEWYK